MNADGLISVVLPIYRQEHFLPRALASLRLQSYKHWELIIIDDGGNALLDEFMLPSDRFTKLHNPINKGLGYSLNRAIEHAGGQWIAYLPADDLYFEEHLSSLINTAREYPDSSLIYSSLRHHYNKSDSIYGQYLQLVQVMHRNDGARWKERDEIESDDLGKIFFDRFSANRKHSGRLTCEWTDHPHQRHKFMQEPIGGINSFRDYYQVKTPLRFHSSCGHLTDEISRYRDWRQQTFRKEKEGLKILIVGELAYNAERMIALAEKGHQLYGLWMQRPYWYNSIGPVPFGHIQDIDPDDWVQEIRQLNPDIIYGCLNWQAVPMVSKVISMFPELPFCWHFKEGPFICIEKGTWKQLVQLYRRADGRIYCSSEMKMWFDQFLKPSTVPDLILDGDLPKKDWFAQTRVTKRSAESGAYHTVVPGRPIGLHPKDVATLASQNIHLHFYGEFTHGQWAQWIRSCQGLAPDHLHIHPNIHQENWVEEFSAYDAGWLHFVNSQNHGDFARCNWDDLNIPARMATLAQAGLPMIQADNTGHIFATQSLSREKKLGVFLQNIDDLHLYLSDETLMQELSTSVWEQRSFFTFDHHAEILVNYFRQVREQRQKNEVRNKRSPMSP